MNFHYLIKRLYYENQAYVCLAIVQLLLALFLIVYLLIDFQNHFRELFVFEIEIAIFSLMFIDFCIYQYLHGFKLTPLTVFEMCCILCFIVCFVAIAKQGIQIANEEVEFALVLIRMTLQFLRLLTLITRIYENRKEQNLNKPLEISDSLSSTIKDNSSVGKIEIAVIPN